MQLTRREVFTVVVAIQNKNQKLLDQPLNHPEKPAMLDESVKLSKLSLLLIEYYKLDKPAPVIKQIDQRIMIREALQQYLVDGRHECIHPSALRLVGHAPNPDMLEPMDIYHLLNSINL